MSDLYFHTTTFRTFEIHRTVSHHHPDMIVHYGEIQYPDGSMGPAQMTDWTLKRSWLPVLYEPKGKVIVKSAIDSVVDGPKNRDL